MFVVLAVFLRTDAEKLLDALRDLRIKHLEHSKAKSAEAFETLYKTVCEQVKRTPLTSTTLFLVHPSCSCEHFVEYPFRVEKLKWLDCYCR